MRCVLLVFSLFCLAVATADDPDVVISNILASETQSQFSLGESGQWLREAHAKQHGCVQAYVTPLDGLSPDLAVGIFASSDNTYPAFIRFSNGMGPGFAPISGNSANESDVIPDIRGMGLKLFNVSGSFPIPNMQTQCFTLTTDDVGFLDTLQSAVSFFTAVQNGKLAFAGWLASNPRLALLFAGQGTSGLIGDLLSTNWYQAVPQMHGSQAAKYHIYPCDSQRQQSPKRRRPEFLGFDYLREQLQADLAAGDVCLRWAVQLYIDDEQTPLNDSTVQWDSPFYDVANISIPLQSFGDDAQEQFCGWMSFNPASTIPDHALVGDLQTVRATAYTNMASLRHSLSQQNLQDATYQDWLDYEDM